MFRFMKELKEHDLFQCKRIKTKPVLKPGEKCFVCNSEFSNQKERDDHVRLEHPGALFVELRGVSQCF